LDLEENMPNAVRRRTFALVVATTAALGIAAGVSPATAGTFTVTNTNNTGQGSFRQAVSDANLAPGADTVSFAVEGTIESQGASSSPRRSRSTAPARTG
jgi:hypothetical protein